MTTVITSGVASHFEITRLFIVLPYMLIVKPNAFSTTQSNAVIWFTQNKDNYISKLTVGISLFYTNQCNVPTTKKQLTIGSLFFSYEVSLAFGLTVQQLPQTLNEINDIINVLLRCLYIERSIILGVFVSFLLLAKES